jgi:NAD-dependent dihydropyrimidine dehydrogenase PreA subunit
MSSTFPKRNPVSCYFVPIDRTFRETWRVVRDHLGHPVWNSTDGGRVEIHGRIVGVDFSLCYGCEKCIHACPTQVFEQMQDEFGRPVVDPVREDECILCLVCEIVCPVEAISIERAGGSDDTLDSLLEGRRG